MTHSKINELIDSITYEEALQTNSFQKVYEAIHGQVNTKLSTVAKKRIVFWGNLFIPIFYVLFAMSLVPKVDKTHMPGFAFISLLGVVLLIVLLALYFGINYKFRDAHYLYRYAYLLTYYSLTQVSLVIYAYFYFVTTFLQDKIMIAYIILPLFCLLEFGLSFISCQTKISVFLRDKYKKNIKVSKWRTFFKKYIQVVGVVYILGLAAYSRSKGIIILNGGVVATFTQTVVNVVLLILIFSLPLLVTIVFRSEVYVQGKLLLKYNEAFRNEYDFTTNEWGTDKLKKILSITKLKEVLREK